MDKNVGPEMFSCIKRGCWIDRKTDLLWFLKGHQDEAMLYWLDYPFQPNLKGH